jgi:glycosyltransferase involved in cell wall biosynthesis
MKAAKSPGLFGRLFGGRGMTPERQGAGSGAGGGAIDALTAALRASGAKVVIGADARFTALAEAAARAAIPFLLLHQTAEEAAGPQRSMSAPLRFIAPRLTAAAALPGSARGSFGESTSEHTQAAQGLPWVVDFSNGVDPARFGSLDRASARARLIDEFGADPEAEFVVFAGTISHDDGVDLLWEAAYDLFFRWPRMHFILIGSDGFDGAFVDQIKQTAADSDFDDRFHFVGERADLAPYLAGADLFALPTRTDAQPVALLEAMAAGLPAVTTDVGSIPAMMNEGVIAFLHPADDPQPIQEGIEKVLMVADVRARYRAGVAARAADFPIRATADQLERIIRSVSK